MGQSQSHSENEPRNVSTEQLGHELALRFAAKCYSHLEITHFKDNFKTLAEHQGDVEYWKEDTLCRFLSIPDSLHAGQVLYQMATYLGAFPFPSLAPCIVTREAMLKIVTIMTGRYKKVLKRGDHDKNKLLFRSMAVFDRRASVVLSPTSEKKMDALLEEHLAKTSGAKDFDRKELRSHATGFAVDEPLNDDEEEDDDDLALAALDSLDAIEVFKQDERKLEERKINLAHIPRENFQRILALVLLLGPLTPQDNIGVLCEDIKASETNALMNAADSLVAAFDPNPQTNSVTYSNFVRTMTIVTPQLFRSFSPLFEHFLFSKQLDLNRHRDSTSNKPIASPPEMNRSPIHRASGVDAQSTILNDILLAQLSCSIEIGTTTSVASTSFFHCGLRLNQIWSIAQDGTSMSSFARQITSWKAATFLILSGTDSESGQTHIIGAYLPEHWREPGSISREERQSPSKAVMFQLSPRHAIFRANPVNVGMPLTYFSNQAGIALGCIIPATSRVQAVSQTPILGPVSLLIDEDISNATFQHDGNSGTGAFLTDPRLEESQQGSTGHGIVQPKKVKLEIDAMEVWGVSFPEAGGDDEITKQQQRLAWEDAEAARRRGVNFGGDKDGARHLLEMAGLVGDESGNRSGGSV